MISTNKVVVYDKLSYIQKKYIYIVILTRVSLPLSSFISHHNKINSLPLLLFPFFFYFLHWRMMIMLSVVRLRKFFPKDWSLFSASESHGINYDYCDLCWHHCYIDLLSLHLKSVLEDEYWETLYQVNSNFTIDLLLHRQLCVYFLINFVPRTYFSTISCLWNLARSTTSVLTMRSVPYS